jgi:hypothetical protein
MWLSRKGAVRKWWVRVEQARTECDDLSLDAAQGRARGRDRPEGGARHWRRDRAHGGRRVAQRDCTGITSRQNSSGRDCGHADDVRADGLRVTRSRLIQIPVRCRVMRPSGYMTRGTTAGSLPTFSVKGISYPASVRCWGGEALPRAYPGAEHLWRHSAASRTQVDRRG